MALFEKQISDTTLAEIRDSINRAWVLGGGRFKQEVERKTGRRAAPALRGGDRKSKLYKLNRGNQ